MKRLLCAVLVLLCPGAVTALAQVQAPIDGTRALIYASVEAIICSRGEPCDKGLPEEMGAPQFLRVDFSRKEIVAPNVTTPIRSVQVDDEQIILQDHELGMGWTMAIERATGKTSITITGKDETFVIFGACILQP